MSVIREGVHPAGHEYWTVEPDVNVQVYAVAGLEWSHLGKPRVTIERMIFECQLFKVDQLGWKAGRYTKYTEHGNGGCYFDNRWLSLLFPGGSE